MTYYDPYRHLFTGNYKAVIAHILDKLNTMDNVDIVECPEISEQKGRIVCDAYNKLERQLVWITWSPVNNNQWVVEIRLMEGDSMWFVPFMYSLLSGIHFSLVLPKGEINDTRITLESIQLFNTSNLYSDSELIIDDSLPETIETLIQMAESKYSDVSYNGVLALVQTIENDKVYEYLYNQSQEALPTSKEEIKAYGKNKHILSNVFRTLCKIMASDVTNTEDSYRITLHCLNYLVKKNDYLANYFLDTLYKDIKNKAIPSIRDTCKNKRLLELCNEFDTLV